MRRSVPGVLLAAAVLFHREALMIDFNALKAEVQMAQQSGRKMCMVPTGELDSLLRRAETMVSVQNLIPFKIGFACQDDVHRMLQGELFRVGLQRTKGLGTTWRFLFSRCHAARKMASQLST